MFGSILTENHVYLKILKEPLKLYIYIYFGYNKS